MAEDLYQCTARQLATSDPETVDVNMSAGDVYEWFQETGYDYAPVLKDGNPVGYIGVETVADEPKDEPIERAMSYIRLQNIISADTQFSEILAALEDQFFYLLGGRNQVTGIITRADLNTSPARIHLFNRISLLERRLRELIERVAPDWKDEVYLPGDMEEKIDRRYKEAIEANVDLSRIHYAGFAALGKIIKHYEECWRACGYEADHKASSDFKKIKDLRNDVAHSNLILQTTTAEYNTQGRSIRDLDKTYNALIECNHSLQTQSESSSQ